MPQESNPTGAIITAGILVTGSTLIRDVHEGKPRAAPIVFGFLMVTALLVIAIPFPKVGRGLAFMSMIGAFLINGPAVLGIASGLTAANKVSTQSTGKAPGPSGSTKTPAQQVPSGTGAIQ